MAPRSESPPPAQAGQRLSLPQAMRLAAEHQGAGRLREAEALLRQILQADPKHGLALHLLGIVAHQSGNSALAIKLIEDAIQSQPEVGLFHTNLCEILRQAGQLDAAVARGRRGAELDPGSPTAHSNLGVALYDLGDYAAAEACQRQALGLQPRLPQALNNLGSIHRQQGDTEGAVRCYREALAVQPDHLEALNNLGALLTEIERPEEAREILLQAIRLNPRYAEAHRNLGTVFLLEEAFDKAELAFRQALKFRPAFVAALLGLAAVRRERNELTESERLIEEALAVEPESVSGHTQLGVLYSEMGFPDRARSAFDRAIALDPEATQSYVSKSHFLTQIGDLAGAQACLDEALRLEPDSVPAQLALVQLKKIKAGDAALNVLEAELTRLAPTAVTRSIPLHFGLGKCYDDIGDHARAFEHFLTGCRLKRARIAYDAVEHSAHIDSITQVFDRATIDRLRGRGAQSELPVFVLGMPRSGTTLTEQIIASHSASHGAGELPDLLGLAHCSPLTGARVGYPGALAGITPEELTSLGTRYVAGLRARHAEALRITDKMPANFYALGLIHLILPQARIIHVKRNPVDTCLSGLTKLFRHGQAHSYDLYELGRFYVDYARLMAHWRAVLPAGAFHEVEYEALVADTETEARRLIAYCGLPWEEACLEFHKTERAVRTASVTQVRQPIYQSSVERWRRYEQYLGPLLEALGDLAPA